MNSRVESSPSKAAVRSAIAALLLLLMTACGDTEITGRSTSPTERTVTLHDAIRQGDVEQVKSRLANSVEPVDLKGKDGPIILAQAIEAKQPAVIKFAIEQGASPNGKDARGKPLLFMAAATSGPMVQLLLDKGAEASVRDEVGQTALHVAVAAEQRDAVDALLAGGIDVNATDRSGLTALHAGILADPKLLDLLVKRGAKVNTTDVRGSTPLHRAAAAGDKRAIAWLLANGAGINAKNTSGYTPLWLARPEVREMLKAKGAKE